MQHGRDDPLKLMFSRLCLTGVVSCSQATLPVAMYMYLPFCRWLGCLTSRV